MDERKRKLVITENYTIRDALSVLNEVPFSVLMVVDSNYKLQGVATEGDIRRNLLEGKTLSSLIGSVMNRKPVMIKQGYSKNQALRMFSEKITQLPVVCREGRLVDILFYREFCNVIHGKKNIIVRARAPLRISFAGGGTDINSYIETKGGIVLSTTINKYCFGTLKKRDDDRIIINSRDYRVVVEIDDVKSIKYDGKLDLIKGVIKLMQPSFGMELHLQSDVAPGSGLGGSATIASVVAGLLNHLRENKFDEYQLAEIAFQAERVELGVAGGWQDQYAAVFGGFNFIEFKSDDVVVHPLKVKEDILNELESSLLLCFTGRTRDSGEIVESQMKSYISKNKIVADALNKTSEYTIQIKNMLLKGDLMKFGQLLHEIWLVKKHFDKKVSNVYIDKLYKTGLKAGAIGGKVLGAGGGGYILFFCPHLKKPYVEDALRSIGGKIMDFNFDFRGLQTWAVEDL